MNILAGKDARTLNKRKKHKHNKLIYNRTRHGLAFHMKFIQINRTKDPSEEVEKAAVVRLEPTHGCRHGDVFGWIQGHQAIPEVVGGVAVSIQAQMTEGGHSRP